LNLLAKVPVPEGAHRQPPKHGARRRFFR